MITLNNLLSKSVVSKVGYTGLKNKIFELNIRKNPSDF